MLLWTKLCDSSLCCHHQVMLQVGTPNMRCVCIICQTCTLNSFLLYFQSSFVECLHGGVYNYVESVWKLLIFEFPEMWLGLLCMRGRYISKRSINIQHLWILLHVCVETINFKYLEIELLLVVVWCGWMRDRYQKFR